VATLDHEGIMPESADIAAILADYVPKADYEAALDALSEATTTRDAHKGDIDKHLGRLTELEKKLRTKAAREAFEKAAEKLKIDPKFKDDIFELAKIPADSDEPDLGAIERHVSKFLEAKPQYAQSRPTKIEAGEGFERGRSVQPGEPEFRVTRKQLGDAVYMRENQSKVAAAAKAGLLVTDD
jgi:tetratricopeptide (TPR) repeat protein